MQGTYLDEDGSHEIENLSVILGDKNGFFVLKLDNGEEIKFTARLSGV